MSKELNKANDFLEQLVESFQACYCYEPKEMLVKGREGSSDMGGGKFILNEEHDVSAHLATLARCWGNEIEEIDKGNEKIEPWWHHRKP